MTLERRTSDRTAPEVAASRMSSLICAAPDYPTTQLMNFTSHTIDDLTRWEAVQVGTSTLILLVLSDGPACKITKLHFNDHTAVELLPIMVE